MVSVTVVVLVVVLYTEITKGHRVTGVEGKRKRHKIVNIIQKNIKGIRGDFPKEKLFPILFQRRDRGLHITYFLQKKKNTHFNNKHLVK